MKVLVLAPFAPDALKALEELMPVVYESWLDTRRLYAPEELAQRVNDEGIDVLLVEADFLFEEFFEQVHGLGLVGVCRTALDHIDVEAATMHGVAVVHSPGRNTRAVAEHTLGLMIALARRIPASHNYVVAGCWQDPVEPYVTFRGHELQGKTLGIIGLGRIGREVAKLGRALGMQVLAHDPYLAGRSNKKAGGLLTGLDVLLEKSDYITLHVPQGVGCILDAKRLKQAKPGVFIVNTSTSNAIDIYSLASLLKSGRVAGVALDVHDAHPLPPNNPLLGLENVILTPHVAGATRETIERYSWTMVEEVRRFLTGHRPRHLVNKEVWRRRG